MHLSRKRHASAATLMCAPAVNVCTHAFSDFALHLLDEMRRPCNHPACQTFQGRSFVAHNRRTAQEGWGGSGRHWTVFLTLPWFGLAW